MKIRFKKNFSNYLGTTQGSRGLISIVNFEKKI